MILDSSGIENFHYCRKFYCSASFQRFNFSTRFCSRGLFHDPYSPRPSHALGSHLRYDFSCLPSKWSWFPVWAPRLWPDQLWALPSLLAENAEEIPARQLIMQNWDQNPTLWLLVSDPINGLEYFIAFVLGYVPVPYLNIHHLACSNLE